MALYEKHDLTRGRIILVDDDLVTYFGDINNSPSKPDLTSMPPRLLREHTEFLAGYELGPLMKKELEFERLFVKNTTIKQSLTRGMLQKIQRQDSGCKSSVQLCYCQAEVVLNTYEIKKEFGNGFVNCSYRKCEFGGLFHKRCVKKLGVEKVSRWYCTACEEQMKKSAYKALNILYEGDTAIMNDTGKLLAEKIVAEMLAKPGGAMDCFKSRLQKLYAGETGDALRVEDLD